MTAALWLCAVWWGMPNRAGPSGFEIWKPLERSDGVPSWEYFVAMWDIEQWEQFETLA